MDSSNWHTIRPWSRRFVLSVKEITAVSATFILSSAFHIKDTEPTLASLGLNVSDNEEGDGHIVANTIPGNLSVKVNNLPWHRFFIRVDEEVDEATIIVFALHPGRQHDIELVIAAQEESLRSQITTDQNPHHPEEAKEENALQNLEVDVLQSFSPDTPSTSPEMTISSLDASSHPTSPQSTITLEDRINQLNSTLSLLQSERESLIGSLKGARRDAHKTDASIRTEIDSLRRASDKHASAEHRARQKVLALQEAIKQSLAATAETNTRVLEIEASLPTLRKKKVAAEEEHKFVKQEAENIRAERLELEEKEKQRIESIQNELAGLGSRLEKLKSKRERLEIGIIPDLEEELKGIDKELEKGPLSFDEPPKEQDELDADEDHDRRQAHGEVTVSNTAEQSQWNTHSLLREEVQHGQIPRKIQILRPSHQPHHPLASVTNKTIMPRIPLSTSSTLSGFARPFEPSLSRQAQLQSTLQSTVKSDLNPTSTSFSPRLTPAYQHKWTSRTANMNMESQR